MLEHRIENDWVLWTPGDFTIAAVLGNLPGSLEDAQRVYERKGSHPAQFAKLKMEPNMDSPNRLFQPFYCINDSVSPCIVSIVRAISAEEDSLFGYL